MNDCRIIQGNALDVLKTFEDESVQMCVTSPPYFGLRDYGTAQWDGGDPAHAHSVRYARNGAAGSDKQATNVGANDIYSGDCECGAVRIDSQIGLEASPKEFVQSLVAVFEEVRRVLKKDGTLWLNLGDSFAGSGMGAANYPECSSEKQLSNQGASTDRGRGGETYGYKPKDLMGIPWRVAFALQDAGWWLRQDIIWAKPNPMPESVTDRCTKSHEYLFLLTKSPRYYYDQEAIKEPLKDASVARLINGTAEGNFALSRLNNADKSPYAKQHSAGRFGGNKYGDDDSAFSPTKSGNEWKPKERDRSLPRNRNGITGTLDKKAFEPYRAGGGTINANRSGYFDKDTDEPLCGVMANKKSVWTVTTRPFKEAHFATFPEKLIEPCILAGSREGDVVLDPFSGAGTTGLVSLKHSRKFLGIELNPEYIKIAEKRLAEVQVKLF